MCKLIRRVIMYLMFGFDNEVVIYGFGKGKVQFEKNKFIIPKGQTVTLSELISV